MAGFSNVTIKDAWVCVEARVTNYVHQADNVIFDAKPFVQGSDYHFDIPNEFCDKKYAIGWCLMAIRSNIPQVFYRKLLEPWLQPNGALDYSIQLTNVSFQ